METKLLVVKAGKHDREFCPMTAIVDLSSQEQARSVALREAGTGKDIPCQWEAMEDGQGICLSWILESLKAGEETNYQILLDDGPVGDKDVLLEYTPGEKVDVRIGGELFTSYCYGKSLARPYLHPLIGPYGDAITRRLAKPEDKDMDHHHHRSVWVSHGDVNGVDNWSEVEGHGRTVHRSFEALQSGPVLGRIRTKSDWVSSNGEKVLEESKDTKIYNLPPEGRIIDLEVVLKATEKQAVFGDTKEGGIVSIRVKPSMEVRNGGKIENSYGGIDETETWGKRAHWCDYSGPVEGKTVGVAILDGPENFRHPTYWHVRDYGLMTANPFGLSFFKNDPNIRGDYTLKAGKELRFSYRLYIHRGDAAEGKVKEKYHDFVNPPVVKVS